MDTKFSDIFNVPDRGTILELIIILVSTVFMIVTIHRALPWLANRLHGQWRHYTLLVVPLLRLIVIIVAFLLSVPLIIEPSFQNMVALFGSLGLALGFALKDYASSLIAGVVAVGETPYSNGDWIKVDNIYGEVTHVGMRTVRVVTPDDTVVHIPHLKLWRDPISNANSGSPQLQCVADFYLDPNHDGSRIRELLHDVAVTSPFIHLDSPISVVVEEEPWGTHYRLRAYPIDTRQQFLFVTDLTIRSKDSLNRLGIKWATTPSIATSKSD